MRGRVRPTMPGVLRGRRCLRCGPGFAQWPGGWGVAPARRPQSSGPAHPSVGRVRRSLGPSAGGARLVRRGPVVDGSGGQEPTSPAPPPAAATDRPLGPAARSAGWGRQTDGGGSGRAAGASALPVWPGLCQWSALTSEFGRGAGRRAAGSASRGARAGGRVERGVLLGCRRLRWPGGRGVGRCRSVRAPTSSMPATDSPSVRRSRRLRPGGRERRSVGASGARRWGVRGGSGAGRVLVAGGCR